LEDVCVTSASRDLGRVFDEVPDLYERVRPSYPETMITDLVTIADLNARSEVLEVGSGTGKATRLLAGRVGSILAIEPGAGLTAVARGRLADAADVQFETTTFERWDDRGRRFDAVVSASAWHWVDPDVGWRRAHDVLRPGGWIALPGNVVVRRPDDIEVYAETADLHQQFCPDDPDWEHPPLEQDVLDTSSCWGDLADPGPLFGPCVVRWYPSVQTFDGNGFADLLRTLSVYRKLPAEVREPLLAAIAERVRTRMGDLAIRRYLGVLRMAPRG
jgi:SAM-dependent methyltransferase